MLTRLIKTQLALLTAVAVVAVVVLGWYFLRIPSLVGIGRYTLYAELPQSGGLYRTANVTYRGITIGKVTDVEPTERGARATMSIDEGYQIPTDASANVHSVSAVGEQYLDLVSTSNRGPYLRNGRTITKSTVPSQIGPALDAANRGLAVLPREKVASLLYETSQAVGGLGPSLQRLVDATQAIAHDFRGSIDDIDDIIARSAPIIDSQVNSGDTIGRWAANLNTLAAQTAQQDQAVRSILANAARTADQVKATFNDVRESLPQTLANLEVVIDMLKRYHNGYLGISRPGGSRHRRRGPQPTTAVPDRLPAGIGVAGTGGHQHRAATGRHLLQDPHGRDERRARCPQLPVRGRARQAGGDPAGVPQQRALCAAGYRPLVRGPESDPHLPRAGRTL
jgi:phospholipid/cholesterol/gamma-HCH transport system substrate-binding protein